MNPKCRPRRDSGGGFTLVELLVVIAIIAVLLAVSLSGIMNALIAAKTARCAGNLRAIGVAFQEYLGDNNNVLPQRYNSSGVGYSNLLLPYVGNNGNIFICPAQPQCSWPAEPSYGMNWYYDNANILTVQQNSVGQKVGLTTTILATDVSGSTGTGSNRADQNSGDPGELAPTRHNGQANYLFFDGHVEKLPFTATQSPLNLWGADEGNHTQS
jgi:prepilin-type processing-associated H-X9-DG protein/prepilin-type N-terminal cleavage/methylation domain-containing protein